jgi:hypothetical protein
VKHIAGDIWGEGYWVRSLCGLTRPFFRDSGHGHWETDAQTEARRKAFADDYDPRTTDCPKCLVAFDAASSRASDEEALKVELKKEAYA